MSDAPTASAVPYGGRLMFAQSWEDPQCDRTALAPRPGETLFAITSGGDNVLGMLLDDPAKIIAVDLNPAQTWLFELKRAAFRRLSHAEMLDLLGVGDARRAQGLYARLRDDLSPDARVFWDAHPAWFAGGLLRQGGFERYFAVLRRILRLAVGRRRMEKLFTLETADQPEFYAREWNTWRWRQLLRIGCSKFLLGNRLDPSWFSDAAVTSFGDHFLGLARHVLTAIPTRDNYFLAQILLDRYVGTGCFPEYLEERNFTTIRDRIGRVELITDDIADAIDALPPGSVDCFALSNVFEYSPAALFERSCAGLLRAARPGARLCLRNLLAPRRLAEHSGFIVDAELSARLRDEDRGFIYAGFEAARLAI